MQEQVKVHNPLLLHFWQACKDALRSALAHPSLGFDLRPRATLKYEERQSAKRPL